MSKVMSLRLKDGQAERLEDVARRQRLRPSQAAARLLEEALRMDQFRHIDFQDTIHGREAFVQGMRIKVWQVEWHARNTMSYKRKPAKIAKHLNIPEHWVESALSYCRAYPEEIEEALALQNRSFEELKKVLPNLERAW